MVQPLAASNPAAIPHVRLKANAVAVPALASNVRPALVLAERESRQLIETAKQHDITMGGIFCVSPTGIQVWDQPWLSPEQGPGESMHLGSVDWTLRHPRQALRDDLSRDGHRAWNQRGRDNAVNPHQGVGVDRHSDRRCPHLDARTTTARPVPTSYLSTLSTQRPPAQRGDHAQTLAVARVCVLSGLCTARAVCCPGQATIEQGQDG